MAGALLARLSIDTTDTAFLGHLGVHSLAAAALALVWVDFTVGGVWQSYGGTVKALVSQAVGANNRDLAGTWLWIAMISVSIAMIPVAVLWTFTGQVLESVGYDHEEAQLAARFNHWFLLSLPPMLWTICMQNFLQGCGDAMPALYINVSLVAVNAALNVVLIYGFSWAADSPQSGAWQGFGFIGSPIATAVTRWISLVLSILYMYYKGGNARRALYYWVDGGDGVWNLDRWREFHLGRLFPLMAGNTLENFQLQLISFLGATLGESALAAHQVMLQLFFFLTSGLYGLVSATTVRVGHNLGAGRVALAKFVATLDLGISFCIGIVLTVVLVSSGKLLGSIFTDDKDVLASIGGLASWFGPSYFFMTIFYVSLSVLQG